MTPLRRKKLRRDERRDALSSRLGRLADDDQTEESQSARRRRLAEQEREAYERSRAEQPAERPQPRPRRARRRLKLRRPKLAKPSLEGVRKASGSGLRATAEQAG